MNRPHMEQPIDKLEKLVDKHKRQRQILGQIHDELTYRTTDRAKRLRREVKGLLDGTVPLPPEPPEEDSEENQLDILD